MFSFDEPKDVSGFKLQLATNEKAIVIFRLDGEITDEPKVYANFDMSSLFTINSKVHDSSSS